MSEDSWVQEPHITVMNINGIIRYQDGKVGVARMLDALEKFHELVESFKQLGFEVEWNHNVTQIPQVGSVSIGPASPMTQDQVGCASGGNTQEEFHAALWDKCVTG